MLLWLQVFNGLDKSVAIFMLISMGLFGIPLIWEQARHFVSFVCYIAFGWGCLSFIRESAVSPALA